MAAPRFRVGGGTMAPGSAAKGPNMGVNRARPARPKNRAGLGRRRPAPNPPAQGAGSAPQAGAAGPAGPPSPWDVNYASTVNAANSRFANQQLDFNQRRTLADQDFGFGKFADAATNPYSRAALLRTSYDNAVRGTRNVAGRQLYAGSYENAQRYNEGEYDRGYDELGREYRAAKSGIEREELAAREAKEREVEEARWRALENAANEPVEPDPIPAGKPKGGKKARHNRNRKRKIRMGLGRGRPAR